MEKPSAPTDDTSTADGAPLTDAVPAWAGFTAAGTKPGDRIYHEAKLTPFGVFSLTAPGEIVPSVLSAGQTIGPDVVVTGNDGTYSGMKSENLMTGKSPRYDKFGKHLLVR